MRAELMAEIADRAAKDADFRRRVLGDLDTLKEYGYKLTEDELVAAEQFRSRAASMSDDEIEDALTSDTKGHWL